LAEHLPGVRTEIVKPRESWVDDPQMRAKVVKEADAAVFAVGL
jgi:ATP-dependent phosphoenolpyruvate carboxykinase